MSLLDSGKIQEAQKNNIEIMHKLAGKIFDGVEKLAQLQIKTLRSTAEENFNTVRKLLSARDPQSFAELQASLSSPATQVEQLMEFNREVYDLISKTQAEVTKLAEGQVQKGGAQVQDIVDSIAKNAPAGAGPAVAMMKSAMDTASSVYESAQKAAKQAADLAESGMSAAANAAGQAVRGSTAKRTK